MWWWWFWWGCVGVVCCSGGLCFFVYFFYVNLMLVFIIILVLLVFYLLILGSVTILERKLLGAIQSRISVYRFIFLGVYQFYLDFLKVLFKGFMSIYFLKVMFFVFIIFIFFIINFIYFLFLLFFIILYDNSFSFFSFIIIFFLSLDCIIFLIKILFIFYFNFKFSYYFLYRIKIIYIFLESLFLFIILFLYLVSYYFININLISYILIILYFILFVLKMFRTPFDYFELESELVGGVSVEISSVGFLLWSLIEYGLILNNLLFLIYIIKLIFIKISFLFLFFFILFFLSVIIIIRGSFVRVSLHSVIYFIFHISFLFIIFMLVLSFFFIFDFYFYFNSYFYFNFCLSKILLEVACVIARFIIYFNPIMLFLVVLVCLETFWTSYLILINKCRINRNIKLSVILYLIPIFILLLYFIFKFYHLGEDFNYLIFLSLKYNKNSNNWWKLFFIDLTILLSLVIIFLIKIGEKPIYISDFLIKYFLVFIYFLNSFTLLWCEAGGHYERFFSMSREEFINSNLNKDRFIKSYENEITSKEFKYIEGGFDKIYSIVAKNLFEKSIILFWKYFLIICKIYLYKVFKVFIFFCVFIFYLVFIFPFLYIFIIYNKSKFCKAKIPNNYFLFTTYFFLEHIRNLLSFFTINFNIYVDTIFLLGLNTLNPIKFYNKYIYNFLKSKKINYYKLFCFLFLFLSYFLFLFLIIFVLLNKILFNYDYIKKYDQKYLKYNITKNYKKIIGLINSYINFFLKTSTEISKEEFALLKDNYLGNIVCDFNYPKEFKFMHNNYFFERYIYYRIFLFDRTCQHISLVIILLIVIWAISNIGFICISMEDFLLDYLLDL